MRITKSLESGAGRGPVSRAFDAAITKFPHPWRFEKMELVFGESHSVDISGGKCKITIDRKDRFVAEKDCRAVSLIIARLLFKTASREIRGRLHPIAEDIIVNREMISRGYGDDLVYYYYQRSLGALPASAPLKRLEQEVAWLSFYPADRYNADFLRKKAPPHGLERIIECLKGDLERKGNLEEVLRILYSLERQRVVA